MTDVGRKVVCVKAGRIYWAIINMPCIVGNIYSFKIKIGRVPERHENGNGYVYNEDGKFLGVSNKCNFMFMDEYRDMRINEILND